MQETECSACIHSRMAFGDQQEMPVFKCHRFPPVVFVDHDGEVAQAFPDAWLSCGEFEPAEKTRGVIGTLRKVRNEQLVRTHARRFLSGVRRLLGSTSVRDQAGATVHPQEANRGKDSPAQD